MLVLRPSYYECQGSAVICFTVGMSEGVRLTLGLPGGTLNSAHGTARLREIAAAALGTQLTLATTLLLQQTNGWPLRPTITLQ